MAKKKKSRNRNKKNIARKHAEVIEAPKKKSSNLKSKIREFYFREYKKLLIIPFTILLISFILIGIKIVNTGDFVEKGVSLKGGISFTINTETISPEDLRNTLINEYGQVDLSIKKITGAGRQIALIIETSELDDEELTSFLKKEYALLDDNITFEQTGSALGERFFKQTAMAVLVSFFFMGVVVFLYFRNFIPSIAIILAAFSDMVVTLAIFNVLGFKLTTAGIAAFLMLIGYSVDTDILLSTRVLKRREGSVDDRIISALKTGVMMNVTTMAAVIVALLISESEVLTQIMTILLIGLLVDMINTWIQNVGILKLYLEKKKG
ncbi:protein translocase subunit SecF [Candidatus Woesearchaeota archaeon]|nr:protein translocase subunit SecF [Candidatus Woesearchaeota archaeon]